MPCCLIDLLVDYIEYPNDGVRSDDTRQMFEMRREAPREFCIPPRKRFPFIKSVGKHWPQVTEARHKSGHRTVFYGPWKYTPRSLAERPKPPPRLGLRDVYTPREGRLQTPKKPPANPHGYWVFERLHPVKPKLKKLFTLSNCDIMKTTKTREVQNVRIAENLDDREVAQ